MAKNIDLVEFVSARYKVRRLRNRVMILCPFHPDKTPSMLVTSDYAYCFACGKGWTPRRFIDALGVSVNDVPYTDSARPTTQGDKEHKRPDSQLIKVSSGVLWRLPEKLSYFTQRGLSEEIIKKYKVGYFRPPIKQCRLPRFTFPAWDQDGNLATISYRQDPGMDYSGDGHKDKKYLNYPRAPVVLYNMHEIKKYDWFVYVGGQVDALSLLQYNIPTVGSMGEGVFRKDWGDIIGDRRVFILLDNDLAGRAGSHKVFQILRNSTIVEWPAGLPERYDVNDAISDADFGLAKIKELLRSHGADL